MMETEQSEQAPPTSEQSEVEQLTETADRPPVDQEALEQFLARMTALPVADAEADLRRLATSEGAAAVPFLSIVAQKAESELALKAMDALVRLHHTEAATALAAIGANRGDARRAKEARRALYKLSLAGVKPEQVTPPPRSEPEPDKVYACLASPIDAEGECTITVVRQDRFGTLRVGTFVLQEKTGITDAFSIDPCSMSMWRRILADAETADAKPVSVELAFCRRQVEMAAAHNERTNTPLPEDYKRIIHLTEGPSEERPRPPELDPDAIRADADLLNASAQLFDLPECEMWLLPFTEVQEHARRLSSERQHQEERDSILGVPDLGHVQWEYALVSTAIGVLFDEEWRALFRQRLEYTADILWRSDRLEQARWAMAAALALAPESTLPPEQHPFLRQVVTESLEKAIASHPGRLAPAEEEADGEDEREAGPGLVRHESGIYLPR